MFSVKTSNDIIADNSRILKKIFVYGVVIFVEKKIYKLLPNIGQVRISSLVYPSGCKMSGCPVQS